MKKYILVLLLIIFIIPSIALASWWNPFSWKIFHKSVETKTEQPISSSNLTNTTKEGSSKADQSTEIEKSKKEVVGLKKNGSKNLSLQEINNKTCQNNYGGNSFWGGTMDNNGEVACNCKSGYEYSNDLGKETCVIKKVVESQNSISCNGKYWTSCPAGQNFYCPATGDAQCLVKNNQTNTNSNLSQEYYDRQMLNLELMKVKMQVQQNTALQDQAISKYKNTSIYPSTVLPLENNSAYSNYNTQSQISTGQNNIYSNPNSQPQINVYGGASSYQRVGNNTYGSDGSSYTQVGNNVYGSDGTSYTKVGNNTYGSDGSSYTQVGNTTLRNDGSSYTQVGNNIYGSDGSSYTKVGNTILGNGGY